VLRQIGIQQLLDLCTQLFFLHQHVNGEYKAQAEVHHSGNHRGGGAHRAVEHIAGAVLQKFCKLNGNGVPVDFQLPHPFGQFGIAHHQIVDPVLNLTEKGGDAVGQRNQSFRQLRDHHEHHHGDDAQHCQQGHGQADRTAQPLLQAVRSAGTAEQQPFEKAQRHIENEGDA